MYVPEKLKLNKFRAVKIPSKAEYMQRFGLVESTLPYTGDETYHAERKTESMAQIEQDMQKFDEIRQAEQSTEK